MAYTILTADSAAVIDRKLQQAAVALNQALAAGSIDNHSAIKDALDLIQQARAATDPKATSGGAPGLRDV